MYLQETLVSRHKMRLQGTLASRQKLLRNLTIMLSILVVCRYGIFVLGGLKLLVVSAWQMLLDLVTVLGHFWDRVLNVHIH